MDRTARQKHDSDSYATRDATVDDVTAIADILYILLPVAVTLSIVVSSCIKDSRQRDFHWLQRPKCSFILFEMILVMEIMYNAVKRLRDGLASRPLSALSAMHVYSSNVMNWVEVRLLPSIPCLFSSNISLNSWQIQLHQLLTASINRILRQKSFKYYHFPSPPPALRFVLILFCLFFLNHIIFTYWLVSICLYCCPFTPSRGVAINVFLVVTIIRLRNKINVIVQIGYFTVFWKENMHGNKYVN